MKGVYFFILLVLAASIVTAGCEEMTITETDPVTGEEKYTIVDLESGREVYNSTSSGSVPDTEPVEVTVVEQKPDTEPVEVTVVEQGPLLEKAEGFYDPDSAEVYDSAYIVEFDETGASEEEDEYDYSIDDPSVSRTSDNPMDAVKSLDEYSVQDNGTVSLNTDTGEITET